MQNDYYSNFEKTVHGNNSSLLLRLDSSFGRKVLVLGGFVVLGAFLYKKCQDYVDEGGEAGRPLAEFCKRSYFSR